MKPFYSTGIIVLFIFSASAFSCVPQPPTASIDEYPMESVKVGQTVWLEGSGVCPQQGQIVAYQWIFPPEAYFIHGVDTANAWCKFYPASPVSEPYVVELRVKNSTGLWNVVTETVEITVTPAGDPWYVSRDGDDENDGRSWETAFCTIQTAINSAGDANEIIVGEGVYQESINFRGKNLFLHSTYPDDWLTVQNTVIDANGLGAGVFFDGSETENCLLQGFTICGSRTAFEASFDGLDAHWKLDETAGTDAADSSGHENDGTLWNMNTGLCWTAGKHGNALKFDGTNDYVEISNYYGIGGTHARTTCAWVHTYAAESNGTFLSYGSSDLRSAWLFMVNGDHKLQLGVNGGNIIGNPVLQANQWYHVAAVLDDWMDDGLKINDLQLYINGIQIPGTYTNPDSELNTGNYHPVRIGTHFSLSCFGGMVDDVRIYDRALASAEIQALYSQMGGICGNGTQAAIANCIIRKNNSVLDGGGIWNADGDILDSFILENVSIGGGGGLSRCDGRIINCVIAENEAVRGGGMDDCLAEVTNCTVVRNTAATEGDGLRDCSGIIANCILWDNGDDLLNSPSLYSCCIEDGDQDGTNNNFATDPNFIDIESAEGPDGLLGTEDDGLCLSEGSACRDSGSGDPSYNDRSFDILGRGRILDSDWDSAASIDCGAYEHPSIWYVDCDVTSSGDGKTWQTAKKTIQEGINAAHDGDVVLVADGTYTGGGYNDDARNRDLDFEGKAITVRSLNGPQNCFIDCDGSSGDPHRGFYFHSGEGPDSVLSGFMIQNGYVNSFHPYRSYGNGSGGAIACGDDLADPDESASTMIINCIFRNNYAAQFGGGVFCVHSSDAIIVNSIFVANEAGDKGGGMYAKYKSDNKIRNCTFVMNSADNYAGGLFVLSDSYVNVTNCIFWGNDGSYYDQIFGSPVVNYSCVQGGYSGTGNSSDDPNFIREPSKGENGIWDLNDDYGDLRLTSNSPCIDAGTNEADDPLPVWDIAGILRRIDDPDTADTGRGRIPIVDMGAYEYAPPAEPADPNTGDPVWVDAGTDKIVNRFGWLELSDADASDEDALAYLWTQIDGPGLVTFDPAAGPQVLNPRIRFSVPGEYTLQLHAENGQEEDTDTVSVIVVHVEAGGSQKICLPNKAHLDATIQGGVLESVRWDVLSQYSDANDVVFGSYDESDYDATAEFTAAGKYTLRITAEFDGFAGIPFTDETIVTVLEDPVTANHAPIVRAWADPNTIISPANTTWLYGQVADDGLPDGRLEVQWEKGYSNTGGQVFFGDYTAENPDTMVTFSKTGTYELYLSASDGQKTTRRPVVVHVLPPSLQPDNGPPSVSAGGDQTIHRSPFSPFTITLSGADVDDPTPTGILTAQWTVTGGSPTGLAIANPTAEQPQITFFETGIYTLELTADDGQYTATGQITITVTTDPASADFQITAGPDQTITLPAAVHLLDAAVTYAADPNQTYPLEGLSIAWSKVAGPGQVDFFIPDDPNHPAPHTELNPSARFSKAGNYTFQLFVSGSDIILLDDIEITVNPGTRISAGTSHSLVVDDNKQLWTCGRNQTGQLGNGTFHDVIDDGDFRGMYLNQVQSQDQPEIEYLDEIVSTAACIYYPTCIDEPDAYFSLALNYYGKVFAWGSNLYRSFGIEGDDSCLPIEVAVNPKYNGKYGSTLGDIRAISAGGHHSLALDAQNRVWSWGCNVYGQLGNGDMGFKNQQRPYTEAPNFVASSPEALELYYRFDNNFWDSSENLRIGRIADAEHYIPDSVYNYAFEFADFDSDGNFIEHSIITGGNDADPNYYGVCGNQSRTISVWIKRSDSFSWPIGTLVSWGSGDQDGTAWEIKCIDGILGVYVSADNFDHKIETTSPITGDENWHHVIVQLPEGKNTLQDIRIWTGAEGQPILKQETICPVQDPLPIQTGNQHYAMIGATYFDPNAFPDPNGLAYHGLMDELQIYNRGLTEEEIDIIHTVPQDTAPIRNIVAVSAGDEFSILLERLDDNDENYNGRVLTFGYDYSPMTHSYSGYGRLGLGNLGDSFFSKNNYGDRIKLLPSYVLKGEQDTESDYLNNIIAISAGFYHAAALSHNKEVFTWGSDCEWGGVCMGYLGIGQSQTDNQTTPVKVKGEGGVGYLSGIKAISAGREHTLALDENGNVWAWGSNLYGQLGVDPAETPQLVYPASFYPIKVQQDFDADGIMDGYLGDLAPIVAVSAGGYHSLALDANGVIWAWGQTQATATEFFDIDSVEIIWNHIPKPMRYGSGTPVCRYRPSTEVIEWHYSIQEAIDAVTTQDGDHIIVYPGVYRENVVLGGKSLTLRSIYPENPKIVEKTIIDVDSQTQRGIVIENISETPTSENIRIEGLTLRDGAYGIEISSLANNIDITMDIDIVKNLIINNISGGIYTKEGGLNGQNVTFNIDIEENRIKNNGLKGVSLFENSSNGISVNCHIVNNLIQSNYEGVYVSCASSAVHNNQISRNIGKGLCIENCESFTVLNNLICENGILIRTDPSWGDFIYGVVISSSHGRFDNNTVVNNGWGLSASLSSEFETSLQGNIIWGRAYHIWESYLMNVTGDYLG